MSYILDNTTPSSNLIFLDTRDVVKSGGMFFSQTPRNDPRPIKTFFSIYSKNLWRYWGRMISCYHYTRALYLSHFISICL